MLRRMAFLVFTAACAWAEEEGGHEAAGLDLWKWVNFGVVAVFLGYVAIKMGGPALRQRAAEIVDALSAGARRAAEAAARAAEIEKLVAGLQAKVEELRSAAREEMARDIEKFKTETAVLVAKVETNAQAEIEAAAKHASNELQALSARLALDLAQQKVKARMTPPAQDSLVDRFVRHLN